MTGKRNKSIPQKFNPKVSFITLTQLVDKRLELLVLAQREDETFVWGYSGREVEILDKNYTIVNIHETIQTGP